jgi:hypothetical protein
MQTTVDRVMRAFTLKHPIPDEEAEAIRKEVTAFASELLEKYKDQLARRTPQPGGTLNLRQGFGYGLTQLRQHARCDQQCQQQ